MASLRSRKPKDSYKELLRLDTNNGGVLSTLTSVVDGDNVATPLKLSTTQLAINNLVWPTTGANQGSFLRVGANNALEWGTVDALTSSSIIAALGYTPLNKAGDTMTGALTLSGAPTLDGHAATKAYVDGKTSAIPVASGVTGAIQFRASDGSFTSSNFFKFDATTRVLNLSTGSSSATIRPHESSNSQNGSDMYLEAGSTSAGNAGNLYLKAGTTSYGNPAAGGNIYLVATSGTGSGVPGNITLTAGASVGNGAGNIIINGGASPGSVGGSVTLNGGDSSSAAASAFGGDVIVRSGTSGQGQTAAGAVRMKTGTLQRLAILPNGAWSVGSGDTSYGASGQVLMSNGNGAPTWGNIPAVPYDIAGAVLGKPDAGATVFRFLCIRAFSLAANFAGGAAKTSTTATASTVLSVRKNGTQFGTITFAAGAASGTLSSTATTFASGDIITVVAPASQDATFADAQFTFAGTL